MTVDDLPTNGIHSPEMVEAEVEVLIVTLNNINKIFLTRTCITQGDRLMLPCVSSSDMQALVQLLLGEHFFHIILSFPHMMHRVCGSK